MENIVQAGIVVVSPQNNPALMTLEFLKEYEILPTGWELLSSVELPSTTHISFKNGYSIVSEQGKVIFQYDRKFGEKELSIGDCKIAELAINYLNQISKVKYSNVGVNYVLLTDECTNSFDKFFSPKIKGLPEVSPLEIKLQEPYPDIAVQNMLVTPRRYQLEKVVSSCIEFRGNLHFIINETSIERSWAKTKEIINSWASYVEPFSNMVNKLKGVLND